MRYVCLALVLLTLLLPRPFLGPAHAAPPPAAPPDEEAYLAALHSLIHPRWSAFTAELRRADARYQDPKLLIELVLALSPDGAIAATEQPRRSGLVGFDSAATDVLQDIGHLPAPPASLASDDGLVYVRLRFVRKEPGCEDRAVLRRRLPLPQALPRLLAARRFTEAAARIQGEPLDATGKRAVLRGFAAGLIRLAARSQDPAERAAAAEGLRYLDEDQALLFSLLTDSAVPVQAAALAALRERPPSAAAIPALKQALHTPGRIGAALLLHQLGDPSGVAPLREALVRGEDAFRCAGTLRLLGDGAEAAHLAQGLLSQEETRLFGAQAAAALGDVHLVPQIAAALRGASGALRIWLLRAVASLGDSATPELRKATFAAMRDPDPSIRALAAAASAQFGDRTPALRYRLTDLLPDPSPEVRAAAVTALVVVGGQAAKDELVRPSRDPDPRVRQALLAALVAHPFNGAQLLRKRLEEDTVAAPVPGVKIASRTDEIAGVDEDQQLAQHLLDAPDLITRLGAAAAFLARHR